MRSSIRRIGLTALAALAVSGMPSGSHAQGYPTRSITVVVPFPAGGASDVVARIVTEHMARTLGQPWVSAMPDPAQASAVSVLVAWELSWYRYRVDLGDEADPVMMLEKGEEIDQIEESLRAWNAELDNEGRVVAGHAAGDGGSEE